jgi:iron uptake system EfeUOB component EfeO/EfeM
MGPRKNLRVRVVVLVVGCSLILSACTNTRNAPSLTNYSSTVDYGHVTSPSPAEQRATLAGTRAYRTLIVTSAQKFAAASSALLVAAQRGDRTAATSDYLTAQEGFDALRAQLNAVTPQPLSIDGRISDFPRWMPPAGLHAIEEDLWGTTGNRLVADAQALASIGAIMVFGLERSIATPNEYLTNAVRMLSWCIAQVIDDPQEQFSHLDLIDLTGTLGAVSAIVAGTVELGNLVNPHLTRTVMADMTQVQVTLRSLGNPAVTTDSQISNAQWRALVSAIDTLQSHLSELAGWLWGFGTGRTYA